MGTKLITACPPARRRDHLAQAHFVKLSAVKERIAHEYARAAPAGTALSELLP
jgi:hypothetical protein